MSIAGHFLVSLPSESKQANPEENISDDHALDTPPSDNHSANASVRFWDTAYITVLAMGFINSLGTWFPSFYVRAFAEKHGIGSQLCFYAIAIMNISNIFGRILPNWLGDRPMDVYIPCTLCCGALGFAMLGCTSPYDLVLFSIFYGFFFAISLYLPLISSITPGGMDIGKRMGVAMAPVGLACLIGNPSGGAILGREYVWWKGVTHASVRTPFLVVEISIDQF
ncbi:hypothetical protein BJ138DRAFT_1006465 [Hygrophoropsis aurantiaca]|uniref:Uncharacterized protein n=1 Tax=Hygrophoropsis aurantiaca TaxID=72124 RepID=A0ACB8AE29_9AGAM|nr:hypothetical protein BJ138DRAFT_1006465 [Hygrophoropsis aurantiaca]